MKKQTKTSEKLSNAIAGFMDIFIYPDNLEKTHLALLGIQKNNITPEQFVLIQELVLASITLGFVIHNNTNEVETLVDKMSA